MSTLQRFLAFLGLTTQDVKMAVRSFVFAFLGILVPGLLDWLNELTKWAPGRPFPEVATLGLLVIAATAAGFTAVVTLVWRAVEGKSGKGFLRPNPPRR